MTSALGSMPGTPLGMCAPCLRRTPQVWRPAVSLVDGSGMCAPHALSVMGSLAATATTSLAVATRATVT